MPPPATTQSTTSSTARTNNLASLANDSVTFTAAPGQAAGKAYIRYADSRQTSHKLVKPLIVLEGYDYHYIAPHIKPLNYSLDQFLREIETTNGFNFRNALVNTGNYDIVFVDYANGTDDILLNAGLFEQVLNWVNTHKDPSSTEQNVVMGMSMGGLIGRYKLAQLEKANPGSTHVRLLVLQDSPQRGANIPLGISAAIRQANNCFLRGIGIKDLNKYIQEAVAILDQPAARQLVKYQTLGPNDSDFFANTFVDGPYRQMINYAAPYKIVAVSQGSQCGVSLFPPYSELLRASASTFNGVLGYIIQTYLPIRAGFGGEVVLNALPGGYQPARVSGLYIYLKARTLRYIPINVTLTRQNFSCPGGLLPLDGAAGSTEPFAGGPNVKTGGTPGWLGPIFSLQYALRSRFSFIQPASALDLTDFTLPALSAKYASGTVSYSRINTDDFIAQEQTTLLGSTDFNLPHLTFTARNGEWIYSQMQNDPAKVIALACTSECTVLSSIAGPEQICEYPSSAFRVNANQVTWTASPSSLFTVTSGMGSQFSTAASGQQGTGTITATLACGGSVSKTIAVGPAEPSGYFYGGNISNRRLGTVQFVPAGQYSMFMDQPYTFSFTSSPSSIVLNQTSGSYTSFYLPAGQGVSIRATASGAGCGYRGTFVFSTNSGYGYRATPNPTTSELTVAAAESDSAAMQAAATTAKSTKAEFTADLYDTYGKKVKTKHSGLGKAVLDVRDLPEGLYNLRVGEGKGAYSEHIQVTH